MSHPKPQWRSISSIFIGILVLLAAAEFLVRGPLRTLELGTFTDFSGTYVASREWAFGANPYQANTFKQTWVAAGGEPFVNRGSEANLRPAYPPSALPLLAPFSFFRWPIARDLFLFSDVALFPFLLGSALRIARLRWSDEAALLSCAFALALAPWHAAIAWQTLSGPVIELAAIGTALRSEAGGGLVTGLALCVKPQMAAWFLLYDLTKKRWKRITWAFALFATVTLLALVRMPAGWLDSYRENIRYFFAIGDVNDFTFRNPTRFELLNLQVIFYYVTRIYRLANILSWFSTVALIVLWWRRKWESDSAQLTTIVLIGLLPVYQRIYNAGVIVLLLPFAIACWPEVRGKLLIVASGVFLFPGTAILGTLYERHVISETVWNQSWWFNLLVGPHCTWAILAIITVLLLWHENRSAKTNDVLQKH
jgi:Glycosyltransferase family 87